MQFAKPCGETVLLLPPVRGHPQTSAQICEESSTLQEHIELSVLMFDAFTLRSMSLKPEM